MSVKTVSTIYAAGHTFRVRHDSQLGEYRVTVEHNGKHLPERTYFTDDDSDALDTMQAMIDECKAHAGSAAQRPSSSSSSIAAAVASNTPSVGKLHTATEDATPHWSAEDRELLYDLLRAVRAEYLEAGLATGDVNFARYLWLKADAVADDIRRVAVALELRERATVN